MPSLAVGWVGHDIRVHSISPGIMNTRFSSGDAQAVLRRLYLKRSPFGFGDPEDMTGAVIILCSDLGSFMTGTDIKIDGEYHWSFTSIGFLAHQKAGEYTVFWDVKKFRWR